MEQVIEDYPTYSVLSNGFIRDLRTGTLHNGHCQMGYRAINLTNPSGKKTFLIHRLVAKAFLPNETNLPEIDHINRITDDNRVENLRWVNDFQQAQNKGDFKNNTSGYKHITCEDNYFRVVICRNKQFLARKRFQNLEDAVKYRNEILTQNQIAY